MAKKRLLKVDIGSDIYNYLLDNDLCQRIDHDTFTKIMTEKGVGLTNSGVKKDVALYIPSKSESDYAHSYFILKVSYLYSITVRIGLLKLEELIEISRENKYIVCHYDGGLIKTNLEILRKPTVIPTVAMNTFQKMLRERYSEEEIDECLKSHQYTENNIKHDSFYGTLDNPKAKINNRIYHFKNVTFVDINKTYGYGLTQIFPKMKDKIINDYKTDKERAKPFYNYVVGMMQYDKFLEKQTEERKELWPRARFWVTNMCTKMMINALMELRPEQIVYFNTDGVMVNRPRGEIETDQNTIGAFKKEQVDNNEAWILRVKPNDSKYQSYTILQYFENGEKVIKIIGGFQQNEKLIEHTDLSKGIAPKFITHYTECGKTIEFIEEVKLNVEEE